MTYIDLIYMSCDCEECERNRKKIIREFLEKKRKKYPKANCIECKIDDCCTNCDIGTEIDEWIDKLDGDEINV